jgi:hypothetical protein
LIEGKVEANMNLYARFASWVGWAMGQDGRLFAEESGLGPIEFLQTCSN